MSTPEELAEELKDAAEIDRLMVEKASPFRDEIRNLVGATAAVDGLVGQIVGRWKAEFLKPAKSHNRTKPNDKQDYENYSRPLIVPAEILRHSGFKELAHLIYLYAVKATDDHCKDKKPDLHRGALYADLAITYLERKQYELGLSWLLAAANQDVDFNRVPDAYGSFALSDDGILGEWIRTQVLPAIPADVMGFVNAKLGKAYGQPELMSMLRSLAGKGDLNLLAGIINFEDVKGRTDYVGHSVRITCLRDLATLFEVLLKQIVTTHADGAVKTNYDNDHPMLAGMLHFMHYQQKKPNAGNKHQKKEGVFWNSFQKRDDLLDAIFTGFPNTSDRAKSVQQVRDYLDQNDLYPADKNINEIAKRFLLALRLRNEASHGFNPADAGIVNHAEEFRLWLLQAILYLYFWARDSGQAAI